MKTIALLAILTLIVGCNLQTVKQDVELKLANDIKPLVEKDATDIVAISNQFVPPYQVGIDCGTGATAWFNNLPPAPKLNAVLPNICSASNTDPNCTHINGLGSAAVYTHLKATQAQAAPTVTLPPLDSKTFGACMIMFIDAGNDVKQAAAEVGALFGGLALGKGALSAAAAKGFAAGLAAPKP